MNAIYARQSLDKKDSLSIDVQEELCRAEIDDEPYKLYIDRGYSGKNTNRPEFLRMMRDIRNGVISKVAVYKLDRLSRSLIDFATMIEEFKRYGVEFLSAREKFDTSTPIGNAMLSIVMVFAQLERETTQVRVRDSFIARMEKGAYDAVQPYGYKKIRDYYNGVMRSSLEPDEETAAVLQEIFETYAFSSKSLGSIARELNNRGIPSPANRAWDSCKLSRMMSNPIYVKADMSIYHFYIGLGVNISNPVDDFQGTNGCVTYGAWDRNRRKFSQHESLSLSVGIHEGLVLPNIFLKCQYKLLENQQIGNGKKGKHSWLTGLLKCGKCGYSMKVSTSFTTKQFVCSGKTNYGVCPDAENLDLDVAEGMVENELLEMVKRKSHLKAKANADRQRRVNKIKIDISKLDEKIERLINALADGNSITSEILNEKISALGTEKKELQRQLSECDMMEASELDELQIADIPQIWPHLDIEAKRNIAGILIKSIHSIPNEIRINWKYNFDE